MKTTPAPEGGAGSDEPIGHDLGQVRPIGYLDRGIVRTSFSNAEHYQSNADSRGSLSTAISTALAVLKRPAAPTPGATTGASGGLPPTRPAKPHPEGRQRVRCKAQSRLIDCSWIVSPAVAQSTCVCGGCGAISCTCAKVTPESEQTASRASEMGVWR